MDAIKSINTYLNMKKLNKISDHVSMNEATYSYTAKKRGIYNGFSTEEHLDDAIRLAEEVFEPLRKEVGGPIKISSFYRSPELNKAIRGSKNSQHCKGQAMDIDDTYGYATNKEMFDFIKDNLSFDQLIWEYGDDNNPDWVHVSFNKEGNRGIVLRCTRRSGSPYYTNY